MNTFERLVNLFAQMNDGDTDVSGITPESNLRADLGFSSLTFILMVLGVDREFGVDLSMAEPENFRTVRDVCDYIDQNTDK